MVIETDIGNFADYKSLLLEMEKFHIESVKIGDNIIFGGSMRIGGVAGRVTREDIRKALDMDKLDRGPEGENQRAGWREREAGGGNRKTQEKERRTESGNREVVRRKRGRSR